MDIKGFFDDINHELLMRAVNKHVQEGWLKLYIERWLKAPIQQRGKPLESRDKGTPQGGVISPLLANLYLHYVFDIWIGKHWAGIQFERYADDIVCHCASEQEAQTLKTLLEQRFNDCGLTLHPKKTFTIAYCKGSRNKSDYPVISFDFLGYTFRPRLCRNRKGECFVNFTPAISRKSAKKVRDKIASWSILRNSKANLNVIAQYSRAVLQGWKNYYGKYGRAELKHVLLFLNAKLARWAKRKYKRLKTKSQAIRWIIGFQKREPNLFVQWSFT